MTTPNALQLFGDSTRLNDFVPYYLPPPSPANYLLALISATREASAPTL